MTPSLFDDQPAPEVERIPLERLTKRQLLAELAAVSDEAMTFHARTRDVDVLAFHSRVVLVCEQARVYLGGRLP